MNLYAQTTTVKLTSSQSWQVPAGVTTVTVECWGGGGGGGASNTNKYSGGGGGGGEYRKSTGIGVTAGNFIDIVVGTGGSAAVGSTATSSTAGGFSSFATTTVKAFGGGGGGLVTSNVAGTAGSGGTGGTGTTGLAGGAGGVGFYDANGSGGGGGGSSAGTTLVGVAGGAGTATLGGAGATAPSGGGNGGAGGSANLVAPLPIAGSIPGGGGGAGSDDVSTGAAGGRGEVWITYSCSPPTPTFTAEAAATSCSGTNQTYTTQSGQTSYVWTYTGALNTDYTITSGGTGSDNSVVVKWLTAGNKTVSVNYTNAGGCSAASATTSTATNVSLTPTPTFTAQPGANACVGVDVTYTTESGKTSYAWVFPGAVTTDYTITSGGTGTDNTVTLKYVTTGSKTVTVNYTSGSCTAATATSSTATSVTARPTPTFTAQPGATACIGNDVTYTTESGMTNYAWVFPGTVTTDYTITSGGTSGSNTVTLKYVTAGGKTVTVNYTNASGCNAATATSSTETTVAASPTPTFTAQPGANACIGVDVTYTTQASKTNYIWSVPGALNTDYSITSGGVETTSNTVILKWLTSGSKTVTINYTDGGCTAGTATSSTATSVNALPTVSITGATSICVNGTTTLSPTTGGTWSSSSDAIATVTNGGLVTGVSAGSPTFTFTATSGGCSNTTASITVNALPTITLGANPLVCGGTTSANLPYLSTTGTPDQYSIVWDATALTATFSNVTNASLPASPIVLTVPSGAAAATYNGTLTVRKSSTGCVSSSTAFTVTVSRVSVTPTLTQPNCSRTGSISLSVSGGTSPYTYDWADVTGTSNAMNRTGLLSGTYSVTVTDANGCSASSGTLTLDPVGTCSGINVCRSDASSVLSVDPDPVNTTYTWTITDAANPLLTYTDKITAGAGTPSITVNWTTVPVGTYTVSVVGSNASCGNSSASNMTVYVQSPTATVSADAACEGGSLNLHASGGTTYSWTGPGGYTSAEANPVIYNSSVATHHGQTYNVTVTDANGCSATGSVVVTVNAKPVINSGAITNTTCGASTGAINLSHTGGATFSWSNGATSEDITAVPSGNYTVIVTNASGCSAQATYAVQNTGGPSATLSSSTNILCNGNSTGAITIVATTGGTSPYTYAWTRSGGGYSASTMDITGLSAGTYNLTVTDFTGCTNALSVILTQPVNALQVDGITTNINCYGSTTGTINITATGGTGAYTYDWADITGTSNTEDRVTTPIPANTYSVTVTDANSCPVTRSFTLTQPSAALALVGGVPTVTNISCNGSTNGQIVLPVTGGTTPYTYTWSAVSGGPVPAAQVNYQNLTGLPVGTYRVTITDAKSCSLTPADIAITQPAVLSATVGKTLVGCNGANDGTITLTTPLGGYGTFEYRLGTGIWQTGTSFTGLSPATYSVQIRDAANTACAITLGDQTITQPAAVSATVAKTDITCNNANDGTITFSAPTGGYGTFEYRLNTGTWQDGLVFSGLSAGTYSPQVRDKAHTTCSVTLADKTIANPSLISVAGSVTNPSCNGGTGSITITASGGTGTLQYKIGSGSYDASNVFSGLTAGDYTITVRDANLCTSAANFTITQPTVISRSISSSDITCNGNNDGSINLTVSGGTARLTGSPYTYVWTASLGGAIPVGTSTDQDLSGLSAGTYSVVITDLNGCTATISQAITQPGLLSATATPTAANCNSGATGSINLTPSGGNGTNNYLWSNGSTSEDPTLLTAGYYSVTITDSKGCTATANATVTEPSAIAVSSVITSVSCNGGTDGGINITVSGGTAPYSNFVWKNAATTVIGNLEDISSLGAGTYTVTFSDAHGCTKTSTFTITAPSTLTVSVSAVDRTCATLNGSASSLVSGGTAPYAYTWNPGGAHTSSISGLDAGIYEVTVTDAKGCTAVARDTVNSPVCLAPTANNDSYTTAYNTKIANATVATNDNDPRFTVLSFTMLTDPALITQGTVTWDPSNNGTFTFTPAPGFSSNFSINYRVTNPLGLTSDATATISVVPLPTPATNGSTQAICIPSTATLSGNTPVAGTGAWSVITGPSTASSQFSSLTNPAAIFTPAAGAGNYTVRWTISNSPNPSSSADATITVVAVPTVPTVGTITQPDCNIATGTVELSGLPSAAYTINPGNIAGNTTTKTVTGLAPGTYNFTVTIDNTVCPSLASADVVINVPSGANTDLGVTKIVSNSTPNVGSNVTFTITASNAGPCNASGVSVTESLPSGYTLISATPSTGTWTAPTWSVGTLDNGASATLTIVATVNATGSYSNTVTITGGQTDPTPGNNSATSAPSVITSSDVYITKTITTSPVIAGNRVQYTLLIGNNGPGAATNVTVADINTWLSNLEYSTNGTSWSAFTGTFNEGTLASGASTTSYIRGTLLSSKTGTLSNTASVSSDITDPTPGNNSYSESAVITTSADLHIDVTCTSAPLQKNATGSYSITVHNNGPSDALSVSVADVFNSSYVTSPEYSINGGTTWLPWTSPLSIGSIAADGNYTFLLRGYVTASATDPLVNTATVSSSTPDPVPANNTSTISTPMNVSADLSVVLTGPASVTAGTQISYSISATNNSAVYNATNVIIDDALDPDIITGAEYSTDNGVSWSTWTGAYTVGTLNASTTVSILIRGNVAAGVVVNIPGTATVTSDTPDPSTANNTSSITTPIATSADLRVTKTLTTVSVIAGNQIDWDISVKNLGPSAAQSVKISDVLPSGLSSAEYSDDGGAIWNTWPGTNEVSLGNMGYNVTSVIKLRAIINLSNAGPISNTATATSATTDPVPANSTSTSGPITVNGSATLSVTCVGNQSRSSNPLTCTYIASGTEFNPASITDVCGVSALSYVLSGATSGTGLTTLSGVIFNPGVTLVTWTVTDACDHTATCSFNVTVIRYIDATNDAGSVMLSTGGTAVTNVLSNDNLSCVSVVPSQVVLTVVTAASNAGIVLNTSTGAVTVTSSVPAGTYTITYQICEAANPGNCSQATISVNVSDDSIIASNDVVADVSGFTGGTSPTNILANDLLNGVAVLAANVNVTTVSSSNPGITLSGSNIVVAPGLPAGNYTLTYQICEVANPSNCAQATVTVPVTAAPIVASDGTFGPVNGVSGSTNSGNILTNTTLNGSPTDLTKIDITILTPATPAFTGAPVPSVNPATGVVSVPVNTPAGTYYITYRVCEKLNPSNCDNAQLTITVLPSADLNITKVCNTSPVVAGQTIQYTLTATNAGPDDAPSITFTDNVPASITGVQYSTNNGNTWSDWNGSYTNGTLAVGNSLSIILRGTVERSTAENSTITNTASISGSSSDPNPSGNSATTNSQVTTSANLSISKQGNPHPVIAGQKITYTISIYNSGPSDALNVSIADAVPAAILSPEYSTDMGTTWSPWVSPYAFGTLSATGVGRILIRGTVNPGQVNGSLLRNTATVSSSTTDAVPGNNSATDEATVSTSADLSLTKVSNPNPIVAGQMITYTIKVSNSGYSDAQGVVVTDAVPPTILTPEYTTDNGASWRPWVNSYTIGIITSGSSYTLLIRGIVIPGGARGLVFSNTASVTSTTADPDTGNNTVTDTNTITIPHPNLAITKEAIDNIFSSVGEIVRYRIIVYNNSEESLYNIVVADSNAVITSGSPIAILASHQAAEVFAAHTVTQADIDTGEILNAVTANGRNVSAQTVRDRSNMVTTKGLQRPQITASKYAAESRFKSVGETIHYTIEVFNCGNVTLKNITVSDPNANITGTNTIASLAPRATVSVRAEHMVTQEDIDAGKLVNIAYAQGYDPGNKPVSDESNTVTLFSNQPDQLTITKMAKENSFKQIGDTIHYEMTLKNYRSTYMSGISVFDANAVITTPTPIWRIDSDKSAIVKAYHVVTQQDLDSGKVVNTAIARGQDFYGYVDQAKSNESTVFAEQRPVLSLTKTAEETSYRNVGDLIHYSNEIRNTGNVKITGLLLTDPDTHSSESNKIAALNAGESIIIHTVHTVTQLDLNVGVVEKTAIISGLDANSQPIRISSNPLIVKGIQNAEITSTLTAAEYTFRTEGEVIHYTVGIRNTGNITLTKIDINVPGATFVKGTSIMDLLPGNTAMVIAEQPVTPADVSAGRLVGQATLKGYKPDGSQIDATSNELVLISNLVPGISVSTVAQESSFRTAGEVIHYSIIIRNNGNAGVENILLSVPGAQISSPTISVPANGAKTVEAIRPVTQADLDAGEITNAASVSGQYSNGTPLEYSANPITIYAIAEPKLSATIYPVESSFRAAGDSVHYLIEVINTGNLTLSNITMVSEGALTISGTPAEGLKPGEKAEWRGVYEVKTVDLDVGKVARSLEVTGMDPRSQPVNASSNQTLVTAIQSPELTATSIAEETTFTAVGEIIHYTITVKNTGNVSIISTAVTDPNALIISVRPNVILMPGESFPVTATHLVTQEDMDAGKVITVAKAEGFDLAGNTIGKLTNRVIVNGIQRTELGVTSKASTQQFSRVGEVISYQIEVKNTGNISLYNLEVTDPGVAIEANNTAASLLPGQSLVTTASHTITQDDLDTGEVVNISKAQADDRNGKPIIKTGDQLIINAIQQQEMSASTETSVSTYKNEGEMIKYTVVVKNTGNVTMKNVKVTDVKDLLEFKRVLPSLAPGESDSVSAEHEVTLADINAGRIVTAGIANGYSNSRRFSFTGNESTVKITIDNYNLTNYPNPFSYETTIVFDLPENGKAIIKIFDLTGQEVGQIEQQDFNQGRNYVTWKTRGEQKGQYILKMYCKGATAVKMVTVIN